MRRPIGSRLHGALDYLTGTAFLAASLTPALRHRVAGRGLRAAGAGAAAYSLVTDYELGARRLLPYRAHLALDAASGLSLVAAALAARDAADRVPLLGAGLLELGAVALSDPSGG
jgi:hypothetical protein